MKTERKRSTIELKSRVLIIRIFAPITLIAFGLAFVITFRPFSLMGNMAVSSGIVSIITGIGASAFVLTIASIVEYLDLRVMTCEKLLMAFWAFNDNYCNLEYLYFEEPSELIEAYYRELKSNRKKQKMLEQIPEGDEYRKDKCFKAEDVARKALESYYRECIKLELGQKVTKVTSDELQMCVADRFKNNIDALTSKIETVINQYIALSEITLVEIENIYYGELYYFFCTTRNRILEGQRLIKPQKRLMKAIKENAFYLKLYRDESSKSLSVVFRCILNIQNQIFSVEKRDEHIAGYSSYFIYNDHYYKMLKEIEVFRSNIYGIKPDLIERSPTLVRLKRKFAACKSSSM